MPADDGLADTVGELLEQAAAGPPASAPPRIQSLDAELAAIADEMIAGEFADETGTIVASDPPELPDLPPEPTSLADLPDDPAPPEPAPTPEPALHLPALEPEPGPIEPAQQTPAVQRVAPPKPAPEPEPAPPPPAPVLEPSAPRPTPAPRSALARVLSMLAAPIAGHPERRALIGWAAAVTTFNAACAWGYILFIRDARPHTPDGAVQIHSPADEHAAPADADPHGGH